MARMLAAAHGQNRRERAGCCDRDDKFRAPRMSRLRRRQQRRREGRAWKDGRS
jgi:hypothetical protein